MPFKKGNSYGSNRKGKMKDHSKTIWLLDSLRQNGVDFEHILAVEMLKAVKGDRDAREMVAILSKFVGHMANAPKQDVGINQIDTLVINRIEASKPQVEAQDAEIVDVTLPSVSPSTEQ